MVLKKKKSIGISKRSAKKSTGIPNRSADLKNKRVYLVNCDGESTVVLATDYGDAVQKWQKYR